MKQLTIDVDDQDIYTTLVLALEDYVASLQEDLRDRIETFGEGSFMVGRTRRDLDIASGLLRTVANA